MKTILTILCLAFISGNSIANGLMLSANDVDVIKLAKEKVLVKEEVLMPEEAKEETLEIKESVTTDIKK